MQRKIPDVNIWLVWPKQITFHFSNIHCQAFASVQLELHFFNNCSVLCRPPMITSVFGPTNLFPRFWRRFLCCSADIHLLLMTFNRRRVTLFGERERSAIQQTHNQCQKGQTSPITLTSVGETSTTSTAVTKEDTAGTHTPKNPRSPHHSPAQSWD